MLKVILSAKSPIGGTLSIPASYSGPTTLDLCNPPRLSDSGDIVLVQERERTAFQRVVDDITLIVDNTDRIVSRMLLSLPPSTYWSVEVFDGGRCTFRGRVASPINVNVREEWVTIRAFSKEKDLWDKLKIVPITGTGIFTRTTFTINDGFATLSDIITLNMDPFITEGYFNSISVDSFFATRPIRFSGSSSKSVGNVGRYKDLDPATTLFELLTAISRYYNAEFHIDPETDTLMMKPRGGYVRDINQDIDDILLDSDTIAYDDSDSERFDFIHGYVSLYKPATPIDDGDVALVADSSSAITAGALWTYRYTYTVNIGGIEVESEPSDRSPTTGFHYDLSGLGGGPFHVSVPVPIVPVPGVVRRNIYRYVNGYDTMRLAGTIEDNTTSVFTDRRTAMDIYTNERMINVNAVRGHVFYYFDATTGKWSSVLSYDDSYTPVGRGFDILPVLRFRGEDWNVRDATYQDIFFFFGAELDMTTFAEQWADVVTTRRPIRCSVQRTDWKYGDTFHSSRGIFSDSGLTGGQLVVKRSSNYLMKDKTDLILVAL